MRIRRALAAATIAAGFSVVLTGTASAADLNCDDFPNQAAAQANLVANPSDPNNLDDDNDGEACESFDYAAVSSTSGASTTAPATTGGQVSTVPTGAVAAGDGSASEDGSTMPFVLGGVAFAAAGGAAVAARRSVRTRA